MFVQKLEDVIDTDREVEAENWTSRRLVLASEGAGFSLHDTVIRAGTETPMWYRHHVEAVYCIEGEGTVTTRDDGTTYDVRPGTVYLLNGNERHVLRADTDLRLVCVFYPPLTGQETHDADGVYPLIAASS